MTKQNEQILNRLKEKLSATEAMEVLTICNEYFESQKRDLKLKSVRSYCKIVKDMRDKQQGKADASKEEKVVDSILKKVLE